MHKGLRILLVEDHLDTQRLMSRLLELSKHTVQAAASIRDALQLAGSQRFDLVISDLGLPDGSGLSLMEELKVKYGLKGIALSGYDMQEESEKTESAGFLAHLTKPVEFEKLQQVIGQVAGD